MRWLLLALLIGWLPSPVLHAVEAVDEAALHAPFSRLLAAHVQWRADGSASTVDYRGFARERPALDAYLAALSAISRAQFDAWPRASRQAFLINAYNGQTIALVLGGGPEVRSIKQLGGWFSSPWQQRFFTLLGAERSLDEVEHTLLRGAADFAEPRIHFAVNCASVGCPALRHEAYVGASLDAQLEDQTRRFLRDRRRNRIDAANGATGSAVLSKIFDWYADDFEIGFRGAHSVQQFLALYADVLAPGQETVVRAALAADALSIDYGDYDWTLNRTP